MASNLWFKARYVEPILAGEKTCTYRRSTRLQVGDRVRLAVGPRPAFATAEIVAVTPGPLSAEARALYPGTTEGVRIDFVVKDEEKHG